MRGPTYISSAGERGACLDACFAQQSHGHACGPCRMLVARIVRFGYNLLSLDDGEGCGMRERACRGCCLDPGPLSIYTMQTL